MQAAGLDAVVIVTAPGEAPRLFPGAEAVTVVENRHPEDGLSGSLRMGLEALPPASLAVLVAFADMPEVQAETCRALAAAWTPDRVAVAPWCDGRRGNPVLVDIRWASRIANALAGDQGLDVALNSLVVDVMRLNVDVRGVLSGADKTDDRAKGSG